MPTSFLDLPLELREEVYKRSLLIEREPNGELISVITDAAYWEKLPIDDGSNRLPHSFPYQPVSDGVLRLGARLLTTCRQLNEEVTPYFYGQLHFLFYRPQHALQWLDKIGHCKLHLYNVAIAGVFLPDEALDNGWQVQADMWASFLRNVPNLTRLDCLGLHHPFFLGLEFQRWLTVWTNETVLEAIRNLAYLRVLHIDAALPVDGSAWESSLEPAFDKRLLETLVISSHPVAGIKWYHEDYFDRLESLKNLTIRNGLRLQSGNSKVAKDFFSHVAPLRSFTWHGRYFTASHQKAFVERHGGTLQFLDLSIRWTHWHSPLHMADRRSEELACLESLTNMFGALPVLKALKLAYWEDCAKLIENMPRSLTVLDLNGGGGRDFPSTAQDRSLGDALRKLPDRCPQLAHVRLSMNQRVADEDDMGRCGSLSIHNHAALKCMSSRIHDTFITSCVGYGCSTSAPLDPELRTKIQQSLRYLSGAPIAEIDLIRPWNRYYASIEAVAGSKNSSTWWPSKFGTV